MYFFKKQVNVAQIDVTAASCLTSRRQSQNATAKSLNRMCFTMRNKLRQSNKCKHASYQRKKPLRPAEEVITIELSGSSCSDDETSPEKDTYSSGVLDAGSPAREVKPLQEQRVSFCARDIKIAPIFLHKSQRSKSKRSCDREPDQSAENLQESPLSAQSEDVQPIKRQQRLSSCPHLTENKASRRGQLSPSALHSCLGEIQIANPAFPVQTVFSTLQRKASLQDLRSSEAGNSLNQSVIQNHSTEKRKRGDESSQAVSKRLRCSVITESAVDTGQCHISVQGVKESIDLTVKKEPRSNKLSRTHSLRQQRGSPAGEVNSCEPKSDLKNYTQYDNQLVKISANLQRDFSFEDVLWPDKYSPQHSSEVIGNPASVTKLQSWLTKWKLRADCDERRQMKERKQDENSTDLWDSGDFQGEVGAEGDGEEPLCNTMLITGPPGVGKTASVYACAQELGFKVFEVNCSSQRSGRHVLAQLKEATQSHLVELSGKDPLKPTYFNNYSSAPKSETLPAKTVPQKNVTSASKKRAGKNFGRSSHKGKSNPATVTLANYFKMKAKADHLLFGGLSPTEKPDSKTAGSPSPASDQTVPQNKKTATSLILFEEVDVIFDEDVGFLAAIRSFMTTTKRPVVLTTNDPSFRERFNCSLEEITFKTPSAVNVCSYLQLVALAENVRLELEDVGSLVRRSRGDVRRCLLQLQLWVHSGGGSASQGGSLPMESKDPSVTESGDNIESQLPPCERGCTASMLGLHPVTQNTLLNLLKFWPETNMLKLLRLLAESWRGGVPLLYTNLQLLLPTGVKKTSVLDKAPCSGMQSEPAPPDPHIQRRDRNVSPKVSATSSRSVRSISRLSRRYATIKADTRSLSSLTQNPQRTPLTSKRIHTRAPMCRDEMKQNAAKAATDCLDALTNFFDLMSYLDATMPASEPLLSGSCRPEAFVWTGAEIKDGLLDEMSEEEDNQWSKERLLDIQAAVEGLGCHRCLCQVSDAWTRGQKYTQEVGETRWGRLLETPTLPASSKRQTLSFSCRPLCAPSVSQRRHKLSRTVLGCGYFSQLGNRQAVSVDYMPVLRYICRRAQRHKEEAVRCLNYLSSIHLGLSKSTIQLLAEDF